MQAYHETSMKHTIGPPNPRSIAEAKAYMRDQRIENGLDPESDDPLSLRPAAVVALSLPVESEDEQLRRVEAIETLAIIVQAYGIQRVQTWIRNIAALNGAVR